MSCTCIPVLNTKDEDISMEECGNPSAAPTDITATDQLPADANTDRALVSRILTADSVQIGSVSTVTSQLPGENAATGAPHYEVVHVAEVFNPDHNVTTSAEPNMESAGDGNENISIIVEAGDITAEAKGTQAVWAQPQELTLGNGLLPAGCMLYQCDDYTYKLRYSSTPETPETEKPANTDSPRSYTCHVTGCGRQFSTVGYLKIHQLVHNCSKTLICPFKDCKREFVWPSHLKYHQLTHVGNRPYQCDEPGCGKAFYTDQRLSVHRRRHTGERPFVCKNEGCNKSFATAGNLKNHARIHTGDKPYVCEVEGCGKGFTELSSLKKHKLVHTGQKPYKCDICSQTFTQSGSRNAHVRNAHSRTEAVLSISPADNSAAVVNPVDEAPSYIVVDAVEEIQYSEDQGDIILDMSQPSTSENVVVLTEPKEMVAITAGFHNDQVSTQEEIVYHCDLLRSGINTEEICPQPQS